jgi:hypothetical protein
VPNVPHHASPPVTTPSNAEPVCGCAACRDDQVGMLVLARRRQ